MSIDPSILDEVSGFDNAPSYIRSALYGLSIIEAYISQLQEGAIVLEVGGGACILSAHLSKKYSKLKFHTIEPYASGFEGFSEISNFLSKKYHFEAHFGEFITFNVNKHLKFDLIFSIDVLEHLPSYENFLEWSRDSLCENGKLVTVFPNFAFPFDYHFRIPIIFNKRITQFIFQHKISHDEAKKDSRGLWESLNFINVKDLTKMLKNLGFSIQHSTSAYDYILEKINSDKNFVNRVGFLARLSRVVNLVGILKIFRTKSFQNLIPFAVIEATLKPNTQSLVKK